MTFKLNGITLPSYVSHSFNCFYINKGWIYLYNIMDQGQPYTCHNTNKSKKGVQI